MSRSITDAMKLVSERLIRTAKLCADTISNRFRSISDAVLEAKSRMRDADRANGISNLFSEIFPRREPSSIPQLSRDNYTRGRDLTGRLDIPFVRSKMRKSISDPSDPALAEIYRVQGFDGKPTLSPSRGVDEVIAAGGRELFRGVTDPRYVDEFKRGPYFPGLSAPGIITGNGTYATTVRKSALDYADNNPAGVIRMALRPDARITDIDRLRVEHEAAISAIQAERRQLEAMDPTPEIHARIEELGDAWWVYQDKGRFAAAQGYDAYSTHGANWGMNDQYWVVLNRTALVVER